MKYQVEQNLNFKTLTLEEFKSAKDCPLVRKLMLESATLSVTQVKAIIFKEAIIAGDLEYVKKFLESGSLAQIKDNKEYCSLPGLNIAIMKQNLFIVKLLIENGEKVNDAQIQLAKKFPDAQILSLLKETLTKTTIEPTGEKTLEIRLVTDSTSTNLQDGYVENPLGDTINID